MRRNPFKQSLMPFKEIPKNFIKIPKISLKLDFQRFPRILSKTRKNLVKNCKNNVRIGNPHHNMGTCPPPLYKNMVSKNPVRSPAPKNI